VYEAPSGRPISFACEDSRVNVRVPEIRGHAMIVFE
jgi:hypothetical protein